MECKSQLSFLSLALTTKQQLRFGGLASSKYPPGDFSVVSQFEFLAGKIGLNR